ncbi:DUF423 domain-containing protein [Kumtagia ephedrae]|uniref:DUF423 domain-containing protein n=1 Tax=Kumtagia ephedrae TaxID=2116701 RepID=A0A2P7S2T4_9HYPH|nr:DUF423 domain-containing protein [Mesorhizobium ephedrae]PSJ56756.1 DUF423 domain-containing protein [Mesorhizobium ephedrae]
MTDTADRILILLAGLAGALGVALSAAAAHRGGANLQTAATFLLVHAPALIGLSLLAFRTARLGGYVLAVALVLFCGDLAARDFLGERLFAYAAPAGGTLLIAGWVLVAVSALLRR